jgi:hypothetical protein
VLRDPEELAALFVSGAVLHRAGCDLPVRGRRGIVQLLTERPDSPTYVALPPHILQLGRQHLCLPARLSTSRAVARKAGVT